MNKALKKWGKRAGVGLAVVVGLAAGLGAYVDRDGIPKYAKPAITDNHTAALTKDNVERGQKLASLLCDGCHLDQETGKLSGRRIADMPPEFGTVFSKNITKDSQKGIGAWTDGELRYFLRTGVRSDGQYVPPWMIKLPHASEEDIDSIIAFLRSDDPRVAPVSKDAVGVTQPSFLAKALAHTPAFKPLPYPSQPIAAPPKSDQVAYGRYLVVNLDCYGCHSADFTKNDTMQPEKSKGYLGGGNTMATPDGKGIKTANLTMDEETGIGKWSEKDFIRAVKQGFRPDGRVLSYPMEPKTELDDEELAAIYQYLRTVPKIKNSFQRPQLQPVVASAEGKALYVSYGCVGCHGDTGKGAVGDLQKANETFPTDAELRRWIDEAPSMKPNTKMPGWKGVIKEEHYPALLSYVRVLSAQKGERTTMR